jgi:hypothetical protein
MILNVTGIVHCSSRPLFIVHIHNPIVKDSNILIGFCACYEDAEKRTIQ